MWLLGYIILSEYKKYLLIIKLEIYKKIIIQLRNIKYNRYNL